MADNAHFNGNFCSRRRVRIYCLTWCDREWWGGRSSLVDTAKWWCGISIWEASEAFTRANVISVSALWLYCLFNCVNPPIVSFLPCIVYEWVQLFQSSFVLCIHEFNCFNLPLSWAEACLDRYVRFLLNFLLFLFVWILKIGCRQIYIGFCSIVGKWRCATSVGHYSCFMYELQLQWGCAERYNSNKNWS